jgi:hypothetical protein
MQSSSEVVGEQKYKTREPYKKGVKAVFLVVVVVVVVIIAVIE